MHGSLFSIPAVNIRGVRACHTLTISAKEQTFTLEKEDTLRVCNHLTTMYTTDLFCNCKTYMHG